jgi:hypothetical protein
MNLKKKWSESHAVGSMVKMECGMEVEVLTAPFDLPVQTCVLVRLGKDEMAFELNSFVGYDDFFLPNDPVLAVGRERHAAGANNQPDKNEH